MAIIIGLIGLVLLVGGWYISARNGLVALEQKLKNSKSQIAVQINSRWDALSSLIGATKQYAKHESETLEKVVAGRNQLGKNASVEEMQQEDAKYQGALSRLMAVVESYPDLKAASLYQDSMKSVKQYEDNVRYARMTYNDMVTKFNTKIKTIPSNIVANSMGLVEADYFEQEEGKSQMPTWE